MRKLRLSVVKQNCPSLRQNRSHNEERKTDLARACFQYAEVLTDRTLTGAVQAQEGDRENAGKLIDEALAIASELGMTPPATRVIAVKERLRPRRVGSTHPDGLTARQSVVMKSGLRYYRRSPYARARDVRDLACALRLLNLLTQSTHRTPPITRTIVSPKREAT